MLPGFLLLTCIDVSGLIMVLSRLSQLGARFLKESGIGIIILFLAQFIYVFLLYIISFGFPPRSIPKYEWRRIFSGNLSMGGSYNNDLSVAEFA